MRRDGSVTQTKEALSEGAVSKLGLSHQMGGSEATLCNDARLLPGHFRKFAPYVGQAPDIGADPHREADPMNLVRTLAPLLLLGLSACATAPGVTSIPYEIPPRPAPIRLVTESRLIQETSEDTRG
jgi:hypothetical protein